MNLASRPRTVCSAKPISSTRTSTCLKGIAFPTACQPDTHSPQDVAQVNMIKMTQFQSLLAPIPPQPPTSQTTAGEAVFNSTGCSICHIQSFTTKQNVTLKTTNGGQTAVIPSLSNVTFSPYSDFLLHDMGTSESGGLPFQPHGHGTGDFDHVAYIPALGYEQHLGKVGWLDA